MMSTFDYHQLEPLLRKPADDPAVLGFIARDPRSIERSAHLGYVEFAEEGVSVMFKAATEPASREAIDAADWRLSAFHLHSENHEGYSMYRGDLPGGVQFGDPESEVLRKLGQPSDIGGGGISSVLGRSIPRWLRYGRENNVIQFQLDPRGKVEMATLYAPDLHSGVHPNSSFSRSRGIKDKA
jgi:hypothetical protein